MTNKMKQVFKEFMQIRFAHIKSDEHYYTEWENRFEQGYEWQYSDYSNRALLKTIAPDVYPDNRDKFFIREEKKESEVSGEVG